MRLVHCWIRLLKPSQLRGLISQITILVYPIFNSRIISFFFSFFLLIHASWIWSLYSKLLKLFLIWTQFGKILFNQNSFGGKSSYWFGRVAWLQSEMWPLKYLGLLSGCPCSVSFWDPLVERVEKHLSWWKRSYISLGGRITLIKAKLLRELRNAGAIFLGGEGFEERSFN